jgi:serine/threonine-protein kinase
MACSFGQIDGETEIRDVPAPGTQDPIDIQPGQDEPADPVGGGQAAQGGGQTPPTVEEEEEYDPDADPFTTEMGQQVKQILEVNCGSCHANGVVSGDMGYILDFKELVAQEQIIPGNKEDSWLFTRMQQQSMPPAFIRDQRPTFGQIDLVGQFIDQLETPETEECEALEFMTSDEQIRLMAQDMDTLRTEDQPFTRYLTVTYNSNAGGCGRELQRQRFALFKGINSVSTEPTITQPQAIDADELIYRIDIRDYNWDREIDLLDNGAILFVDGWEAIVAQSAPYSVEYIGEDADELKADAQTAVPFMAVNAFIQFTEVDDLYYSLIGGKANLFDYELEVLGIDTELEIADDNLMRAGFSNSGVSKQERVLNRFDSGVAAGQSYWISFDFDGGNGNGEFNVANESIYADPIGFAFAGGEAIFSLPNGMQGYYVAAANGNRLGEAPVGVVIDPAQNNGVVVNGASCHTCHNAGLITFQDTVKDYVIDNAREFDNETFESVMAQYPEPAEFQRQMDLDSEVHIRAVERAGIPRGTPDPITRTFLDFQLGNLTLEKAAGELNVTADELQENLQQLDPRLGTLSVRGNYVDRDVFTDAYLDALCELQTVSENQPANCP